MSYIRHIVVIVQNSIRINNTLCCHKETKKIDVLINEILSAMHDSNMALVVFFANSQNLSHCCRMNDIVQ